MLMIFQKRKDLKNLWTARSWVDGDGNLSAVHSMIIYSNATVTSNRDRLFLIDLSESIFLPSVITNNITQEY